MLSLKKTYWLSLKSHLSQKSLHIHSLQICLVCPWQLPFLLLLALWWLLWLQLWFSQGDLASPSWCWFQAQILRFPSHWGEGVWLCYPCPHNISLTVQDIEYLLLLLHREVMLRHADIYQDIHLHLQFLLLNQADLQKFMSNCQKRKNDFSCQYIVFVQKSILHN